MDNEPNEKDKGEFDVRCPECRCEFCAADQLAISRPPGDRDAAGKDGANYVADDMEALLNIEIMPTPEGIRTYFKSWIMILRGYAIKNEAAITAARADTVRTHKLLKSAARELKQHLNEYVALYRNAKARVKELEEAARKVCSWREDDAVVCGGVDETDHEPGFTHDYEKDLNTLAALLAKGARDE